MLRSQSLRLRGGPEEVRGYSVSPCPPFRRSSRRQPHPVQCENHHLYTLKENDSVARGWRLAELFSLPGCHVVNKCPHEQDPTPSETWREHFYCSASEQILYYMVGVIYSHSDTGVLLMLLGGEVWLTVDVPLNVEGVGWG